MSMGENGLPWTGRCQRCRHPLAARTREGLLQAGEDHAAAHNLPTFASRLERRRDARSPDGWRYLADEAVYPEKPKKLRIEP